VPVGSAYAVWTGIGRRDGLARHRAVWRSGVRVSPSVYRMHSTGGCRA
jgi:hypothetical protein